MSFTRKIIQVTLKLGQSNFSGTGADTLTITGLQVRFHMRQIIGLKTDVQVEIFGLTDSQMKQFSTYGSLPNIQTPNLITIAAGDNESGLSVIFHGILKQVDANYAQPASSILATALDGAFYAISKAAPVSYKGSADVAIIMGNLAAQSSLNLENSGVSVKLSNPYFSGSIGDQIKSCARAAGINHLVDTTRNVLAIWPRGGSRGGNAPLVSPQTGLVGYPTFALQQISFVTELNPNIEVGRHVQVESSIPNAVGTWTVTEIVTDLETETPDGAWFQSVTAFSKLPEFGTSYGQLSDFGGAK